ncbi:hypothetical protein JQK87_17535 [Streptomyces sp. G44]|uniref:hypothetical protein n=1 Tax=Streptomyces sp. G44 TaxID=2807632 RepID=UPI00195F301B|nr:hypothetical protein [Streptomyces sp. G44]MBM7170170.1 hypothetical protein [Streptomyces sp. G44]
MKITDWTGAPVSLLAEYGVAAAPGRGVLEVYAADSYVGDSAALVAAKQAVVVCKAVGDYFGSYRGLPR